MAEGEAGKSLTKDENSTWIPNHYLRTAVDFSFFSSSLSFTEKQKILLLYQYTVYNFNCDSTTETVKNNLGPLLLQGFLIDFH